MIVLSRRVARSPKPRHSGGLRHFGHSVADAGVGWGSHGHRRLLADRAHALNPADLFGGIRSAELKVEVISPASSLKPNHPLDKPAAFSDSRDAVDIFDRLIQSYQQTQLE